MAELRPGVHYGLLAAQHSSTAAAATNRDLVFVKLTDSALRAIQSYVRSMGKLDSQGPTITFSGNDGQIAIPSLQHGTKIFNFSTSSTADMEGPGGSFECVQQVEDLDVINTLEVLNTIPKKIRVHANEDVYETTRHRMTIAEESLKNKCTREIQPTQKDIGRRVKIPPINTAATNNNNNNSYNSKTPLSRSGQSVKAVEPLGGKLAMVKPKLNGSLTVPIPANKVLPKVVSGSSKPSTLDINRRPLRERLIHLLALRPFKKVELHERLKDTNRGKDGMTTVLNQIAYMKDNCYHLNRAIWNEVNEEWPFYSESDKQILKRRKPENLTPPGVMSDGGSSISSGGQQSPSSLHAGSPPPQLTQSGAALKRSAVPVGNYDSNVPTKRQRISHYSKPPSTNSELYRSTPPSIGGGGDDGGGANKSAPRRDHQRFCDSSNVVVTASDKSSNSGGSGGGGGRGGDDGNCTINNVILTENNSKKEEALVEFDVRSPPPPPPPPPLPVEGPAHPTPNGHTKNCATRTTAQDFSKFPDYLTEYTTIKDVIQRRQYKSDFNADYTEYKNLHAVVLKISMRFLELENRLKRTDPSSRAYREIKELIVREFQEDKKNSDRQAAKQRFQYLHEKLSHIKRLVLEYDQGMINASTATTTTTTANNNNNPSSSSSSSAATTVNHY